MEFKITIILNAQNYIKEFIEDDELYIESIENITINKKGQHGAREVRFLPIHDISHIIKFNKNEH